MISLKKQIKTLGKSLGFDLVGFCTPEVEDSIKEKYNTWLRNKHHANMHYMEKNREIRIDPSLLLPDVQTIIVVAMSYTGEDSKVNDDENKLDHQSKNQLNHLSNSGKIARYAQSRDYHKIFKKKMKQFIEQTQDILKEHDLPNIKLIPSCDTKPILEKYFAQKAGLGFIGKNSLLITKDFGSYVFLGCFLTNFKIEPDQSNNGTCGNCTRCYDSCPTKAINKNRTIDSNKCLAYWTIEHKGDFPQEAPKLAGNLFGCDLCQEVCPYNKRELKMSSDELKVKLPQQLDKDELLTLSEEEFLKKFAGTPLMRAGYQGIRRNALALRKL